MDTLWQVKGENVGDTVSLLSSSQSSVQAKSAITLQNIQTALGYIPVQLNRYAINVQALTSSPTDAQTVFFGMLPKVPVTAAATSKVHIRRTGTITGAEIYCFSGTAGTNEAWTISIRKNNTTDYTIATVSAATSERIFTNQALSIPVVAGDYIEIKSVNPTWATNPLTTIFSGYIIIE